MPWKRWRKAHQHTAEPQPCVEDARRQLEAVRAERAAVENKAKRLRWHLEENDFRTHVLGLRGREQQP